MIARVLLGVVALVCVPVRQTPVRDIPSAPAIGAATLAGVLVIDDAGRRPIRRAVITLNAQDGTVGRTTITDDSGRFAFSSLPAGRFSLVATKAGYVTSYYRSKRPGRPPAVPIPLTDGQRLEDVTMTMMRGAVITGRVMDPSGQPAPFSSISAGLVQTTNGERALNPQFTNRSFTDERGVYRVYGLVPGDYIVSATPVRAGASTDVRVQNPADIQRAQLAVREARAGTPAPAPVAAPAPQVDIPTLGYSTVYFPGTTDFASAVAITVGPGEERADADISMSMIPMSSIDGVLMGPDGQPVGSAMVTLVSSGPRGGSSSGVQTARKTGAFNFSSLTPGQYTLLSRATLPMPAGAGNPPAGGSPLPLWAAADLTIDGRNFHDLTLTLQPGVSLSGRVAVEATSGAPPDLSRVQVSLANAQTTGATLGVPAVQADARGAFTFTGVMPGSYRLTATLTNTGPGAAWTLKSSIVAGRDVCELPLDVRPGEDVTGAVVTLSDRIATLSGVFRDATGAPSTDYSVVVFSADRRYWTRDSRRVRGPVRPGSDGTFVVNELPPGEYFLAAVTDVDASELADSALLDQLAASAVRVTLGEGEKKRQDLRVAGRAPGPR